ncbi:hypothetical protein DXG01_013603, partial [Tephrocybe rancida]
RREAEESASDCTAWQQREYHASLNRVPGKKGATVFYWEAIDGFRVRRFVERKQYDAYWKIYGPGQRQYDSFHHQWDACTEFREDEIRYSDNDDDDDDGPETPTDDHGADYSQLLPEIDDASDHHLQGSNSSRIDLEHLQQDEISNATATVSTDSAEEAAQFRFGMNFIADMEQLRTGKEESWQFVSRYVGNGHWLEREERSSEPSSSSKEMIRIFFAWMKSSAGTTDMPVEIYDVLQDRSS